ncbi:MAG: DUF4230 domain-containing protein [Eudoraea sp.]|nr:DUF4230 domain-containing protein [Eudoraea sp.]
MESVFEITIGLLLGIILTYWVYSLFRKKKRKERTEHQSTVLLEKIKSVCKLISVEGDFAEIYRYENSKEQFLNLFTSKKKALVVINAKTHIGYDLSKIQMHSDTNRKTIVLKNFPQPEVLSISPELEFYDIKNDLFYAFTPKDLTDLTKQAKQHILDKIPESGLMDQARSEALESILIIEKVMEMIGWRLDYSALEIQKYEKPFIKQ